MGRVLDGVYAFDQTGQPELHDGPSETQRVFRALFGILRDKSVGPEQLGALAEVAKAQREGSLSQDQAVAAAAAIKPEFAGLIRGQESGWLALILMILFFFIAEQSSRQDHAETMATLQRTYEQELRTYAVEQAQLEALQRLATQMTAAPPLKITQPPEGPRTKRQQRRDRRFDKSASRSGGH